MEMYWYANCVTRRFVEDREVPGVYFPAFIHNGDYFLTSIVAYQDGMVECWGLVPFAEFVQKVRDGWVVTSVPDGATVSIHHVAQFTVSDGRASFGRRSFTLVSLTRSSTVLICWSETMNGCNTSCWPAHRTYSIPRGVALPTKISWLDFRGTTISPLTLRP